MWERKRNSGSSVIYCWKKYARSYLLHKINIKADYILKVIHGGGPDHKRGSVKFKLCIYEQTKYFG